MRTHPFPSPRRAARSGAVVVAVLGSLLLPAPAPAGAAEPGRTYVIRRGDTLSELAPRFGTTVSALASANGLASRHRIIAGRSLVVPSATPSAPSPDSPGAVAGAVARYEVQRGDTLDRIAARTGVGAADLAAWNGVVGGRLYAGTRLVLADPGPLPAASTGGEGTHVVAAGQTLGGIARRHGTTVRALAAANGLGDPNRIVAGTRLRVPGSASVVCPVAGARFVNDWGYPRPAGTGHAGIDMFAPRGTTVRAPVDGSVRTATGSIGGLQLWLTDGAGNTWFASHLDTVGATGAVRAGDVIGTVGTTGNAVGGPPHLHVGYRPAGGAAANPYPLLRAVC